MTPLVRAACEPAFSLTSRLREMFYFNNRVTIVAGQGGWLVIQLPLEVAMDNEPEFELDIMGSNTSLPSRDDTKPQSTTPL